MSPLRKLYRLMSPRSRRSALLLLGLMLGAAALEVLGVAAIPAFVGVVIDRERLAQLPLIGQVAPNLASVDQRALILWGALALAGLFLVKTAYLVMNYRAQVRFVANRRVEFVRRLLRAYMDAPFAFHLRRNSSELLRNIDHETTAISQNVMAALLELGSKLVILVAVLGFLMIVEPAITLFWFALFGSFAAFVVLYLGARLKKLALREQKERKTVLQTLYQAFGSIKEARVLGREGFFVRQVDVSMRKMADVFQFKQTVAKSINPITEFVAITGLVVLAVGLVALGRPIESILVTLSLFVVALVRLKESMSTAMTHLSNLRYNLVAVNPVYDDLTALEDLSSARHKRDHEREVSRHKLEHRIELRGVWHYYDRARDPALKDVSLTLPAGSCVGFVGSTGAGKSTLVDVILGLLEPERGSVLVDGEDIYRSSADTRAWRNTIGYVPQSIYLLDDTIRRNIALGLEDKDVDDARLNSAIEAAQLQGLVERLPERLETLVGERGARLSGGERQRIGIARALYHQPDVLVLDEATSALDNETERAVIRSLEALKANRTIIMIAHRLSSVRNCDKLHFLKDGRIDAEGTFDDLRDRHAEFSAMAVTS